MVFKLFSQRKREAERSGKPDVYQYDNIPAKLRIQLQQIFVDAIGPQHIVDSYALHSPRHNPQAWLDIQKVLKREFGRHSLCESRYSLAIEDVLNFLGQCDSDEFVDCTEVCCRYIEIVVAEYGEYHRNERGIEVEPRAALKEINYRIREAGIGYAYESGQIFRVDSDYTHDEVVRPALRLMNGPKFNGAQQEFLQAHEHYRNREFEDAIIWAAKAFESGLKAACDIRGWSYDKGARATDLLKIVRRGGLWPDYLDPSFDQLLATLGSGLPKVRNDAGAHGQGPTLRQVPEYVASYALNLAASKLQLISRAVSDT